MSKFSKWLEDMGQDPRTWLKDAIFAIVRFFVVLILAFLPMQIIVDYIAGPGTSARSAVRTYAGKPGTPYFWPLIIVFAIYPIVAVLTAISISGGWFKLGRKFPAPGGYKDGQRFLLQSASFGWMGYNNILVVRVGGRGLYFACPFPFNFLHRPLLIPWGEIKSFHKRKATLGSSPMLRLTIGSPKLVSIFLGKKNLIAAVEQYLGRGEQPAQVSPPPWT